MGKRCLDVGDEVESPTAIDKHAPVKKKTKKSKKRKEDKECKSPEPLQTAAVVIEKGLADVQAYSAEKPERKSKTKHKKFAVGHTEVIIEKDLTDLQTTSLDKPERKSKTKHKKPVVGETHKKNTLTGESEKSKSSTVQAMLTERLKNAQNKRNQTSLPTETVVRPEHEKVETPKAKNLKDNSICNQKQKSAKTKAERVDSSVQGDKTANASNEEEVDSEKAEIRKKKREKRKQKKLEKEKRKQEQSEKAGTAKNAAYQYLETWKSDRNKWKFLKVRQCWLLQNMYDQTMINDEKFAILLEYLEGLQGKSREATAAEAEAVIKTADSDSEEENEESSTSASVDPVKQERARQIVQLLSL